MEHRILLKCRLCLEDCDETKMCELFQNDHKTEVKLCQKVEHCLGIGLRQTPYMPTKICQKCFEIVLIWYTFRKVCLNAQLYLENLHKNQHELLNDLNVVRRTDAEQDDNNSRQQQDFIDLAMATAMAEHDNDDNNDYDGSGGGDGDGVPTDIKPTVQRQNEKPNSQAHNDENAQSKNIQKLIYVRHYRRRKVLPPTTYLCNLCGKEYIHKSSFIYHMARHQDTKPFECEICDKSFYQVRDLETHFRKHTGERPYKCKMCDRRFADLSCRSRHQRTHTNDRPYECHICGKTFMFTSILKRHIITHTEDKKFNCLICQKSFAEQHKLKLHLLTSTHKNKEAQLLVDDDIS